MVRREAPDSPPSSESGVSSRLAEPHRAAPEVHAPLRESTVAQRAGQLRTEAETVVQVTIDRIDVRLPAPPAAERSSGSKARSGPKVSLSDYLRQRDRRRHGGSA